MHLKYLFFWDMASCHWVNGTCHFKTAEWSNLQRSNIQWWVLHCLEPLCTKQPVIWYHIPE